MTNSEITAPVLVTGGTGFVGIHCILQLLEKGYRVKTTIRSLSKKDKVLGMLRNGGVSSFENLEFIEADLTSDANWDVAASGCDYILHVASPISLQAPKDELQMIMPAVEGTLRVLNAARRAAVKRVVMTSNFGAVGYSHKDTSKVISEESWTDPNEKGLSAYNKSKVMAERAAWKFAHENPGSPELSVINPVGIFGPSLDVDLSSGFGLLKKLFDGSMKTIPNITLGIVDVRDVADLHIRAMLSPAANGERFLALAGDVMTLPEIAVFFKNNMGKTAKNISTKTMPDWKLRIAALLNPVAKNIVPMLGKYRDASNEKAKTLLGWRPRTNAEALLATAESLLKFGNIP
jgi:nucleoside-diphosphate-sugar epimerase